MVSGTAVDIKEFIKIKYINYWQSIANNISTNRSITLLINGSEHVLLQDAAEYIFLNELKFIEHPDFHVLKSDGQQISVDLVRSVIQRLTRKPAIASRHCLLIDMVEDLSVAATNALLKTLEEPVGNCLAILLNQNSDLVLPTVKSRSFLVNLPGISPNELIPSVTDNSILAVALSLFPNKKMPENSLLDMWFRGDFQPELDEYFSEKEQLMMLIAMFSLKKNNINFDLYYKFISAQKSIANLVGANKKEIVAEAQYMWRKLQKK